MCSIFLSVLTYLLSYVHRSQWSIGHQRPPRHRTLFWAALVIPDQLVPCCFSSALVSRLQLLRGRLLFLFLECVSKIFLKIHWCLLIFYCSIAVINKSGRAFPLCQLSIQSHTCLSCHLVSAWICMLGQLAVCGRAQDTYYYHLGYDWYVFWVFTERYHW